MEISQRLNPKSQLRLKGKRTKAKGESIGKRNKENGKCSGRAANRLHDSTI